MLNKNFNKEAMREKIKKNMDLGFSIIGIKRLLLEEQISNLKTMQILEARNVELQDQLEFIKEEYGPESNKIPSPA